MYLSLVHENTRIVRYGIRDRPWKTEVWGLPLKQDITDKVFRTKPYLLLLDYICIHYEAPFDLYSICAPKWMKSTARKVLKDGC